MSNTYNIPKKNIELNERIAREVMGWRQHDTYKHLWYTQDSMKPAQILPDFSGDMNDAWMVVEKLKETLGDNAIVIWFKDADWTVAIDKFNHQELGGFGPAWESGSTAPYAICLAALKTLAK